MELNIEEKVFMVAASSKGLGFGIARELALNGATVCIASRTKDEVESAAENLRKETGATVLASVFDASDPESITKWVDETANAFERIDGLVVNAGGPPPGNFDDFSDADNRVSILMGDAVAPRREWIDNNVSFEFEDNFTLEEVSVDE